MNSTSAVLRGKDPAHCNELGLNLFLISWNIAFFYSVADNWTYKVDVFHRHTCVHTVSCIFVEQLELYILLSTGLHAPFVAAMTYFYQSS